MRDITEETRARRLARYYDEEINASLARGLPFGAALGLGGAAFCIVLLITGMARDLIYPATYGVVCGLYSLLIIMRARRGRLSRRSAEKIMVPFALFPTVFFFA